VHVHHHLQRQVAVVGGGQLAHHFGGGAKGQVRLNLRHGHLYGAVAKDLQHQGTVELDVGLHEHGRGRHFTEQFAHGRGEGLAVFTAAQHLVPAGGQTDQHAANRQAFEDEFVEFVAHGVALWSLLVCSAA